MIRETVEALKKAEAEAAELVAGAQRQAREKRRAAEESGETFRGRFEAENARQLEQFSIQAAADKEKQLETLRESARRDLADLDRQAADRKKTAVDLLRKTLLDDKSGPA